MDKYIIATNQQALKSIRAYCTYMPRTHFQVKQKLYGWKCCRQEVENILATLIEEGSVNESLYAVAYANERLSIHHWGKKKIESELKKRGISPYCIKDAITPLTSPEYLNTLQQLAAKKWNSLTGKNRHPAIRRKKTAAYLLQKGYESNLVWGTVKSLQHPQSYS